MPQSAATNAPSLPSFWSPLPNGRRAKHYKFLALVYCRRTWCHHLVLDFLAVRPGVSFAGQPIRGIGTGILASLAGNADAAGRSSGRWSRDEDEEVEEDASSDSFEVIEVSDGSQHIDQWVNLQDQPVAYGRLPLEDGEVLPAGALDDEQPDEQRLMEATGNEGASFERSYRRAALVIWPQDRFASVLIQAGVGAALPHLAERLAAGDKASGAIAEQIIEAWEQPPTAWSYRSMGEDPSRTEMLRLLAKLGERALLKRFISSVVTRQLDGSENEALATGRSGSARRTPGNS